MMIKAELGNVPSRKEDDAVGRKEATRMGQYVKNEKKRNYIVLIPTRLHVAT